MLFYTKSNVLQYLNKNKLESLVMKLKQALVLGLTTAFLAIPAFAADKAINAASQPSSAVTIDQQAATPDQKEAFQKKGQKNGLSNNKAEAKKTDPNADLSKLGTVNPNETAKN
jgi:hypothetical protein